MRDISEIISRFIVKYIWILCALLVFLECLSTGYSAMILMERTSVGVLAAASGEISSRVSSILRLITSLSTHEYVGDVTKSTHERAVATRSFQEAYDLFMVAVTDEYGNVSSFDEVKPPNPGEEYSLMYRDYMQRLHATGEYQITDPIVSGADGKTINYTIAVPIIEDGKVMGSVFGSIYFDEIQAIITRNIVDSFSSTYLFGREKTLIADSKKEPSGTELSHFWDNAFAFGLNKAQMNENMTKGFSGDFWIISKDGFEYVVYEPVKGTEWTIVYSCNFFSMVLPLLPMLLLKVLIYILICGAIMILSKRMLKRKFSSVNQLLAAMSSMHRRLFQNDCNDYTTMIEITQEGLIDRLTGLSTRTLFHNKLSQWDFVNQSGAVIFIDLDNLKAINDGYGHEAGDTAIQFFGEVLKQFESSNDAIVARYGGDEFIAVIKLRPSDNISEICRKLNSEMHKEIEVSYKAEAATEATTVKVSVNASIGAASYPEHGIKAEDLISKADIALYEAKRQGKGCWVTYSGEII